jgi:hypothetical protein
MTARLSCGGFAACTISRLMRRRGGKSAPAHSAPRAVVERTLAVQMAVTSPM